MSLWLMTFDSCSVQKVRKCPRTTLLMWQFKVDSHPAVQDAQRCRSNDPSRAHSAAALTLCPHPLRLSLPTQTAHGMAHTGWSFFAHALRSTIWATKKLSEYLMFLTPEQWNTWLRCALQKWFWIGTQSLVMKLLSMGRKPFPNQYLLLKKSKNTTWICILLLLGCF